VTSQDAPEQDFEGLGDAHFAHTTSNQTVVFRQENRRLRSLRERQWALLIVCLGTFMTAVDGSAVYVALPSIQSDLGFASADLAWVVNAYLIPFGGLLLFAGRLGDFIGPKRVFLFGVGLFVAASALCALAGNAAMLLVGRALQGAGGALLTGVALGLIIALFAKPRDQGRALGGFGFVAASAAASGLLIGAALTEAVGWELIFLVNLPVGVATIIGAVRLIDDVKDGRHQDDRPAAVDAIVLVVGLALAVYTIIQAGGADVKLLPVLGTGAVSLLLLAAFAVRQVRTAAPLIPPDRLRARNLRQINVTLALMLAGPTGMFFLAGLYLRQVLGFSVLELGLGFLPLTAAVGFGSLKVAPRLLRETDAKTLLLPSLVLMAAGLALMARVPADGSYLLDVFPGMMLLGIGGGLGTPAALQIALVDATENDRGLRSGLVNTAQQLGAAVGLAIIAPIAAATTSDAFAAGKAPAVALTEGFQVGFLVGFGILVVAIGFAVFLVQPETPRSAPQGLDDSDVRVARRVIDPAGLADADMVCLGMGSTGMMAMLWSIAQGRRVVGVDLRGGPFFFAMQWPLREDLYHHFVAIDRLMVERYGLDNLPTRVDGTPILLHECVFRPNGGYGETDRADTVLSELSEIVLACPVGETQIIDDRLQHGERQLTLHPKEPVEDEHGYDPLENPRSMAEVLLDRPRLLTDSAEFLVLLRRYLEGMEDMDLERGVPPRVRLLTYHRTAEPRLGGRGRAAWRRLVRRVPPETGLVRQPDGRIRVRVEAIRELDRRNSYSRVRDPHGVVIDLGVPELLVVAEGTEGPDARRLGLRQQPVMIDYGHGPVPAEVDYIMGSVGVLLDGVCRRRIASVLDAQGQEHWVRQTVEGHETYADVAWTLIEIARGHLFDPVGAGMVSRFTPKRSRRYRGALRYLSRDYFTQHIAHVLEMPVSYLRWVFSIFGPRIVRVQERIGENAQVGTNAVVAGDSFGIGIPLEGRGPITGMVGHGSRVGRYWYDRDRGVAAEEAMERLATGIKEDTEAWIAASEPDFAQPGPPPAAEVLEKANRERQLLLPQSHRDDWSRLKAHVGGLHAHLLPRPSERRPDDLEAIPIFGLTTH
jgi:MFS family permease